MRNLNTSLKRDIIKEKEGIVILDLKKYRMLKKKLEDYEKKEKLLRNVSKFENLAKWGRSFAKRKKITLKKVLEND